MKEQGDLPAWGRGLASLALILALVFSIYLAADWATSKAKAAGSEGLMIGLLSLLLLLYVLLMAIPFMPGIEIGISLLLLKGAEIAPLVYGATVLGLVLAFLVGRYMPYRWLHGVFLDLRMSNISEMIDRIGPMSRQERLTHLADRLPKWLAPIVGTGRYLVLALTLNLPGNAAMGGGGGIAFVAGCSRLFAPFPTILVIALAVLPVPLTVWLTGANYGLENWR